MSRLAATCGVPVSLQHCSDGMTNVWQLFENAAYSFATKNLRSATIESHFSAIKCFRRTSRGFDPDTTHPVLANGLKGTGKGAARSHAGVGIKQPGAGLCRGPCCSLARL